MPITGEYEPSASPWVAEQVAEYEASGGTRATTLRDTGIPVVIVTMRGGKSGKVRKIGLMRVEAGGSYALVASKGGHSEHPDWYHNLIAYPKCTIQDGPEVRDYVVRELRGHEREAWWATAAAVFPNYNEYAGKAGRTIPVLLAEPV